MSPCSEKVAFLEKRKKKKREREMAKGMHQP